MVRRFVPARLIFALLPLSVAVWGCGSMVQAHAPVAALSRVPTTPPARAAEPSAAAPAPAAVEDPVVALIAASQRHFDAGEKELDLGHLEGAKQAFNRALGVLLESPYGARSEPRIREQFDRLVDRISSYELKALAQGDGFTEKQYEPASIDELLAMSATFDKPAPEPGLTAAVATDLQSAGHDIPIPLNQRVLSYVELFQGRLHDFIAEGLERGSKYLPMIQNVFRAEGLPLDLAYVPLIESAFKPNALSRTKAKGVWQFMRGTARENGLRHDWYIDERSDPEKATVAAARYLKALNSLFNGDWHLALASYNGGPGRVQRAMRVSRLDDFWSLADRPRLLPRETREYVPMILAAIVIARNPAQYGFNFDPQPAAASETVTLPRPIDLRRVAEWTNTTVAQIQALNPELRRWTTPVRDSQYELKVPAGTADIIRTHLADTSAEDLASLKWYTVKRGETLLGIARKLRVSGRDLAEANYITTKTHVNPGEKLMVPHEATILMAARTVRSVPPAEAHDIAAEPAVLATGVDASNRVKVVYEVKPGDTLASIARLFKTSVASLRNWNRLPGNRLNAGERLTVWARRAN